MQHLPHESRPIFNREVRETDGSVSVIYRRDDGSEFCFRVPPPKKSVPPKFLRLVSSEG